MPNHIEQTAAIAVGVVSLGCDKNRVDTEQMLAQLLDAGYEITPHPQKAQVIIVNTCAFIQSAQQESIDTILEMAEYKRSGRCRVLLVSGCLSQRFLSSLAPELPEVDGFIGVDSYGDLPEILPALLRGERIVGWRSAPFASTRRVLTTPRHLAFVRIAEGCDNFCTYCAIPGIRGRYRSRKMEEILEECAAFAAQGVRELVLVAQDTTRYGQDIFGRPMLAELLQRICAIPGDFWVRALYCYPEMVNDRLLQTIQSQPKICNYLDVPIQHVQQKILRRMHRRSTGEGIRALVKNIRENYPDIALRTTVIVGFPGENQAAYRVLRKFLYRNPFDHLGAFAYSREEGTPAARMGRQIDARKKAFRQDDIMAMQARLAHDRALGRVGRRVRVLVEGYDEDLFMYVGRSQYQAYEIDSNVCFFSAREISIGSFVDVRITQIDSYDWMGEMIE